MLFSINIFIFFQFLFCKTLRERSVKIKMIVQAVLYRPESNRAKTGEVWQAAPDPHMQTISKFLSLFLKACRAHFNFSCSLSRPPQPSQHHLSLFYCTSLLKTLLLFLPPLSTHTSFTTEQPEDPLEICQITDLKSSSASRGF